MTFGGEMMEVGNLFNLLLMASLLIGTITFAVWPFIVPQSKEADKDYYQESELHSLIAKRDTIYAAIKDLEFEQQTSKLSDEDYQSLRHKLELEAAEVLKDLNELKSGRKKPRKSRKSKASEKSSKQATITSSLKSPSCPSCGAAVSLEARFCPSCGLSLQRNCPKCGSVYQASDNYCPECGAKIS